MIEQGVLVSARLFAIPLLLAAAYLGYQLVAAILDNLRAFSILEFMSAVIGLATLAVLFLAFALPGLFLLLGAKQLTVDAEQHQVVEEMRWLMLAHKTRYSTEPFCAVRIDYAVGTTDKTKSNRAVLFTFDVTLVDSQDRARLLAMFRVSELEEARALAKDLSNLLHLKLSDHSAKWDPAARGRIPQDILPIRERLEQRGLRGIPLEIATWIARGFHFIVDLIIRL